MSEKIIENKTKRQPVNGFKKGKSGNPGGRPKLPEEVKEMCRANSVKAIQTAIDIMTDPKKQPKDRLKAAEIILDRGYGKPAQAITGGEGANGEVKPITIETIARMLGK